MSASDLLDKEIIDKIETPSASVLLIKLLIEEGRTEIAVKACLKALEIFPDDINIRRLLAETYFSQGHLDLAEIELDRLAYKIGELSSIFKLQAKVFRKEDRLREAIKALELYLAHHKSDKEASQLLSELNSLSQEEKPVLPTPTLAEIYYNQGALDEAIRTYQQVLRDSPDDAKSKKRLKALMEIKETGDQGKGTEGIVREQKIKFIGILERWLSAIESRKRVNLVQQP
ncbi:MAG: tetratricopeptide repeat protein [Deltaproteobacteria bacterium]|nr:tetratricopeptide repeat protein [Deltaproteobacteria bacterium]MBW2338947.1 tetratricopeptide repeat protein [Deltaproteobacteria bacterium]